MSRNNLLPHSGCVELINNYLPLESCKRLQGSLLSELSWKQYPIKIFGKEYLQPRLIAFVANPGVKYAYSRNKALSAQNWTKSLTELKDSLEGLISADFNCVLANYYRDGRDSMGLHADNEASLGSNPTIASYSIGTTRQIRFIHNRTKEKLVLNLAHNSLLLMRGSTQDHWKHEIPKSKNTVGPRWNLTFRQVIR